MSRAVLTPEERERIEALWAKTHDFNEVLDVIFTPKERDSLTETTRYHLTVISRMFDITPQQAITALCVARDLARNESPVEPARNVSVPRKGGGHV